MNPPSSIHTPQPPRRILVRGVNWLGDAVMTTPALLQLRARFPQAHIALVTPEKLKDLWLRHPAVNETISFATGNTVLSIAHAMRMGNFDVALVLPNSPRSAMEVWLARIPRRIGYVRPWRNWFLTQRIAPRPGAVKMHKRSVTEIKALIASPTDTTRNSKFETQNASAHHIHDYLHLVAALGADPEPVAPQLFVTPDEIEAARKKAGLAGITNPVLGLIPGAEYGPAKRWPVENFIAAAREIQERIDCIWLILGGKTDIAVGEHIQLALRASHLAPRNLAGQTSLRELMALLKLCRNVLTNDTGPMHVAAALGTPVVVPFGSTSPELTGPGLPGDPRHRLLKSNAPCSPCFLRECPIDFRCMTGISVERVVAAVVKSLNR